METMVYIDAPPQFSMLFFVYTLAKLQQCGNNPVYKKVYVGTGTL